MIVGIFSILVVLAWCLLPALLHDKANDFFLGAGIKVMKKSIEIEKNRRNL